MSSEAKSNGYQEQYLKKYSAQRPSLLDPPSLLTDRSAYVSFLEEQLERVSSACMVVSSYDQRFNEMQGLIVSLESRVSTNTKLLGIAQKYTEEVKIDLDMRLDGLIAKVKKDHEGYEANIRNHTSRIEEAEEAITDLSILPGRVHALETSMTEKDGIIRTIIEENIVERNTANSRFDELEATSHSNGVTVDKMQNTLGKHIRSTEENERNLNNMVLSVEARLKDVQAADRADAARRVQALENASKAEDKRLTELLSSQKGLFEQRFAEVDKKVDLQAESLSKDMKAAVALEEEERCLSMNKLRKDVNSQTHVMESALATVGSQIKSHEEDMHAYEVDTGRSFNRVNERLNITEKDMNRVSESMEKFKPLVTAIASQMQSHTKTQNKLEKSVRQEQHKLKNLQEKEAAFEMRQKKIDQDIRDREREFEHKQGHLDSKIEARLATEEKAIEANAALLKAQAATQVQQNAVIQAQLHADEDIMRENFEKLKNLQEHEEKLEGLVKNIQNTEYSQKKEIDQLKEELDASVVHHKEVDRSFQNEIDLEKQAKLMNDEYLKIQSEVQEQRNKLILAQLSHDDNAISVEEAKLRGLEVKEETLQHLASESKMKWDHAKQHAEKHRSNRNNIPSSFPEMRRPTFAAGASIKHDKYDNILNQSLSSDSAYGIGNGRNDGVQDALNQFLHEYKLPLHGNGGRGRRSGGSRGVSLSPPRVKISMNNDGHNNGHQGSGRGRQRQSYSVSPDRSQVRSRSQNRNQNQNMWNYSPTRGRAYTRRTSRRVQQVRDAERSAHGKEIRQAVLAESFALSELSENSITGIGIGMDTTNLTQLQAQRLLSPHFSRIGKGEKEKYGFWYPTKTAYRSSGNGEAQQQQSQQNQQNQQKWSRQGYQGSQGKLRLSADTLRALERGVEESKHSHSHNHGYSAGAAVDGNDGQGQQQRRVVGIVREIASNVERVIENLSLVGSSSVNVNAAAVSASNNPAASAGQGHLAAMTTNNNNNTSQKSQSNQSIGDFSNSNVSETNSTVPTVEVLAERPHRVHIEPTGQLMAGSVKVKKTYK